MRGGLRGGLLVGCLALIAIAVVRGAPRALRSMAASGTVHGVTTRDRDVASGLLLDSAPPPASIERGLEVAEGLRLRYGIDSGNARRDREAAAARARREVLDPFVPDDKAIGDMAAALGYSLEPARCGNACGNIRDLAVLELKKRALESFVRP